MLSLLKRQVASESAPLMRASFSTTFAALKKESATKKTKQSNGVKRPTSAYSQFTKDYYKQHRSSLPKSIGERSVIISEAWKKLSDSAKQPFVHLAHQDKERYETELAEYKATLPPKRPVTGFIRFFSEIRPQISKENPNSSNPELARIAGAEWSKLSDAEKKPYNDAYQSEKAIYDQENPK